MHKSVDTFVITYQFPAGKTYLVEVTDDAVVQLGPFYEQEAVALIPDLFPQLPVIDLGPQERKLQDEVVLAMGKVVRLRSVKSDGISPTSG